MQSQSHPRPEPRSSQQLKLARCSPIARLHRVEVDARGEVPPLLVAPIPSDAVQSRGERRSLNRPEKPAMDVVNLETRGAARGPEIEHEMGQRHDRIGAVSE